MATGLHIPEQSDHRKSVWIASLLFVALLVASGWYGYRYYTLGELPPIPVPVSAANPGVDEAPVSAQAVQAHTVAASNPRYLSIPAIGVDKARVLELGTKANGELDTPRSIYDIGWYRKSATPGLGNSALLMDGHNGGPTKDGVFKKLPELKSGDTITIERGDGRLFEYVVQETKIMTLDDLNNGGMKQMSLSVDDTKEGLNLISCTGNWVPAQQTYDKRSIVRAVAVE